MLAIGIAVSSAIVLELGSHLTFVYDDWGILINRDPWTVDSLLDPYNEHLTLGPIVTFKLLVAAFGIDSALPFRIVAIGAFMLSAVVLFVYLRECVGDWAATIGAILIVFLGASFENLLWPVQLAYFGSMAAGIGMLLALRADDVRGDRWACALLMVSLAFASIGFAFAAAAIAELLLNRRRWPGRIYVVAVPLTLVALWWLGWGHQAESGASISNLGEVPEYVFDAAAGGIVALLGLSTGDGSEPDQPRLIIGQLLLGAGLVLGALRIRRLGTVPRQLLVVLAAALAFWVLAGLNVSTDRAPTSSRYTYPSAVFLLLIAGELLRGLRIPRPALAVASAATVAAAIAGFSLLHREYEERWLPSSESLRASLGSIEITADHISPEFPVVFGANLQIPAGVYLQAVDDHGSPAYSDAELAARDEPYRAAADTTLASALALVIAPSEESPPEAGCTRIGPGAELPLAAGTFTLTSLGPAPGAILLGRFSDSLPVSFGTIPEGTVVSLSLPADRSTRQWRLGTAGDATLAVCPAGGV
jgi:hypothetical protein